MLINNFLYIIAFIITASIPYVKYLISGAVPLTSDDPRLFYSFFSFFHKQIHLTGGISHWNPYYALGLDTLSLDPFINPYRLPNLIGFLFREPMHGWIFLLVMQVFLMGVCSFRYFLYLGIKPHIAFICGLIYMLTPLHDEFIYQGFWGVVMFIAPLLLVQLHRFNNDESGMLKAVLLFALSVASCYLSAGAVGTLYLVFGSLLYTIFILISPDNFLSDTKRYLFLYSLGGIWAICLSAYILYPFAVESRFMVRYKVFDDYVSISHYLKYLFHTLSSFLIPLPLGIYLKSVDVMTCTAVPIFSNTWHYINIAIVPAVVCAFAVKGRYRFNHRRHLYLFLFLLLFVLNPFPVINFDLIFEHILKSYTVSKLFMFYSLAGCVIIGFFLQWWEDAGGLSEKVKVVIRVYLYLYSLVIFFLSLALILSVTSGFSVADTYIALQSLSKIINSDLLSVIVAKIPLKAEKFAYYFNYFVKMLPFYYLYYFSLFLISWLFLKRDRRNIKHNLWYLFFGLCIVVNVNTLYTLDYPFMDSGIMEKLTLSRKRDPWTNHINKGERVAFHMDYENIQVNNSLGKDEYRAVEKMRVMDSLTFGEITELAQSAGPSTCFVPIRLNPFMNSYLSLFSSYIHFMYPGYREYFHNMNASSEYFINRVKSESNGYQFPLLYKGFNKKMADRFGIGIIFSNKIIDRSGLEFIGKNWDNTYIYRNSGAYPPANLTYRSEDMAGVPVNFTVEEFFRPDKNNEDKILIRISDKGEKRLTTTIPYNRHWKLYGNGEPVDIFRDAGFFISAVIPSEVYELVFSYKNSNFTLGVFVSAFSLIIWLVIYTFFIIP